MIITFTFISALVLDLLSICNLNFDAIVDIAEFRNIMWYNVTYKRFQSISIRISIHSLYLAVKTCVLIGNVKVTLNVRGQRRW